EVDEEIPGIEVRGVHGEELVELLTGVEELAQIELHVLRALMELEEVRLGDLQQRPEVMEPHRQPPGAMEAVVAAGLGASGEIPGVEEVSAGHVAMQGDPEKGIALVGLQAAARALDLDVRRGHRLPGTQIASGHEGLREIDAVHELPGGQLARTIAPEGLL